jgi:predicted phage replisome organizer
MEEESKTNGRYYYLMLKENFFESDDLIFLESMENGYLYSNILLKLYLKSLKDKGRLMYKDRIPYNSKMISQITRHNIDVVDKAIKIFKELGILDILDNGAIYMLDIENFIGKSSTNADRQRQYQRRINQEKQELLPECKNSNKNSNKNSDEHIEIEIELKNKDKNNNLETTTTTNIYSNIESNFGRTLSPMEYETIESWLSSYEEEIINYAVKISVLSNKKTFNYVNGILKNWKANGYSTLQDIKDHEEKPTHQPISEEKQKEFDEIFEYDWLNDPNNDLN